MKLQAIQTNFPYATFIQLKIVAKKKKKTFGGMDKGGDVERVGKGEQG